MDDREFRNAMGKFATGVTVITTEVDGEPHGMTANAFMSVSLHPKLIMISIDNRANMLDKIKEANKFAVNILADHQKDLSMHFAGQTKDEREIDFQYIENIPVLDGTLASIACDVDNSYVVGDHTLFVGKVLDIKQTDGNPLTFFTGKYGHNQVLTTT
ncbi:MAG TPA: flavin reductase family protein [Candidatus Pseudogracilibacillus intestinigallinarum]|uniref:Flavin reductase family protein n=1 Tax=Candidatus Pseudogracilibacillus intestinigallinarum TaxID=2838742 RepID=A0A9D1PL36_9BACI|nr:flavin reductase family protein [Candidatus Pseudogracilibacillus intestinigallinarum]